MITVAIKVWPYVMWSLCCARVKLHTHPVQWFMY